MQHATTRATRWWNVLDDEWALGLLAVAMAVTWTLLGILIAAIAGQTRAFVREWLLIQGTFAVLAASFLALLVRSDLLEMALRDVLGSDSPPSTSRTRKRARGIVTAGIAAVGTLSTTQLGFRVEPPSRYFMWATCLLVCISAGLVTWHFLEIIETASRLPAAKFEVFAYSPGETRSLRKLATYYATFGAATTVGYIFAFIGTVANEWTGNPTLVRGVQALWPVIYVPCCLLVLVYPHLAIRRIVRSAKDRLVAGYQRQINALLTSGDSLTPEDIQRVNALADLIERVQRTPNFALRLPIIVTAVTTTLANFATLLVPQQAIAEIVKSRMPWP